VAECFAADLSRSAELAALVARIQEACGPIHTLINEDCDPSLRVFPWQQTNGQAHADPKTRTKPALK
jgi:hypothetical protein